MQTALEILRWINLAVWLVLLAYMLPGAGTAVGGKNLRRGDPMRLGIACICLVMIGGNLRWLFAADSLTLLATIHALAAAAGLYLIRLGLAYGRGPRI